MDIRICRNETVYQTHVMSRMAARFNHVECLMLRRCKGLVLHYRSASIVIRGVQLLQFPYPVRALNGLPQSLPLFPYALITTIQDYMNTLEIIIEQEALLSPGAHG